jgi:hypothetical protein
VNIDSLPDGWQSGSLHHRIAEENAMAEQDPNEDLKAKMREALARKQNANETAVGEGGHHSEKGPAERGQKGGGGMFRRRAGGGG